MCTFCIWHISNAFLFFPVYGITCSSCGGFLCLLQGNKQCWWLHKGNSWGRGTAFIHHHSPSSRHIIWYKTAEFYCCVSLWFQHHSYTQDFALVSLVLCYILFPALWFVLSFHESLRQCRLNYSVSRINAPLAFSLGILFMHIFLFICYYLLHLYVVYKTPHCYVQEGRCTMYGVYCLSSSTYAICHNCNLTISAMSQSTGT